jgi:hypothetical protein
MERYIGMDVHAASCTLAVISDKGRRLRDFPVETNGEALVEAVRMIPGRKHLVFEEGLQSAWLYETLSPHVDELVVTGITESRGPKERQARCVWLGREASRGEPGQDRLQGTASVHAAARALADPHDFGGRHGAGAVSDQELVPIAGGAGLRRECLRCSSPRGVAGAALFQCSDESHPALRSSRLLAGAERSKRRPIFFERRRSTPSFGFWRQPRASVRSERPGWFPLWLRLTGSCSTTFSP